LPTSTLGNPLLQTVDSPPPGGVSARLLRPGVLNARVGAGIPPESIVSTAAHAGRPPCDLVAPGLAIQASGVIAIIPDTPFKPGADGWTASPPAPPEPANPAGPPPSPPAPEPGFGMQNGHGWPTPPGAPACRFVPITWREELTVPVPPAPPWRVSCRHQDQQPCHLAAPAGRRDERFAVGRREHHWSRPGFPFKLLEDVSVPAGRLLLRQSRCRQRQA